MEYIKEGFTLPVPLNLVPTPIGLYNSFKKLYKKFNAVKYKTQSSGSISVNSLEEQPSAYELKSQISTTFNQNQSITNNTTKFNDINSRVKIFFAFL